MRQQPLQWHPAFQAAMQIDLLIIKMEQGKRIEKSIGRLFRRYNIIEYKGPSDYLSINDFYKVTAYACLYQSDTQKMMKIPCTAR